MKKWVKFYRRLKTMGVNGLSQESFVEALQKMLENASFEFSFQQEKEKIALATKVLVADVRQNPEKKIGFKPDELEPLLKNNNWEYKRYPRLGNPFYYEKDKEPAEVKRKYFNYLGINLKAKEELNDLLSEFRFRKIVCLICYCQTDKEECHRFWLKDVLIKMTRAKLEFVPIVELTN